MRKQFIIPGIVAILFLSACGSEPKYPTLLAVREGNLYGYMDKNGDMVIPVQFAYAMDFSEGRGAVNVGGTNSEQGIPRDGKWGFIDRYGQFVINPKYYSPPIEGAPFDPDAFARVMHEAYEFHEGLALVRIESQWAYIDTAENIIIQDPRLRSGRRFSSGLANVYMDGRWGYINRQGNMIIDPQFLFPADWKPGLQYLVTVDASGKKIVINRSGNRLLDQYQVEFGFYDGATAARERFRGESASSFQRRKFGIIDTTGRYLHEPQFDEVGRCGSGLCPVLVGSRAGHPIEYPAESRPESYLGGKWGYVNYDGKYVINPTFEGARGFSEEIAAVLGGNGLWGYRTLSGNMISDFEFTYAGYFHNGLAAVRLGPTHSDYEGRMARINTSGTVVWIEPK